MRKLTYDQKVELYEKRKEGYSIGELAEYYCVRKEGVKYLLRLIDFHGLSILRNGKNHSFPVDIKEKAVREVLEKKETVGNTAIKYGLSCKSVLTKWINEYIKNNGQLIDRKRGRKK